MPSERHLPQPSLRKIAAAACFIPILGWIDYITGYDLGFSPFYFAPIAVSAWYGGRAAGLGAAILCAITWLLADVLSGHTYANAYYNLWNTLIRFISFLVVLELVLDRRRLLSRERARASSDPLTDLANRRAFHRALDAECLRSRRYGHPLSVAYLDLDNFKQVNDRLGHEAGDHVLKAAAATLKAELRSADLAARLGGDEFALLLPETAPADAAEVVHRIHRSLTAALQGTGHGVTVSIGCTTYPIAPADSKEVVAAADATMYRVKQAGKNAIVTNACADQPPAQKFSG